ncbi:MAG: ATPase, T2SS/T4P/T4SS family [Edaphobacter sp.]|uniref:ATPase, T2SS/T4P/T4SS family n=1 Tax=Edaphobacter sp. TaxID=1934404 RepID=UPI0023A29C1F|nr:ATPase, T2SS/T4P/T4SS family [Edaphobacter sp.]MDE1177129.1 ATPase, T2SS/T4P/T4SS family [Edaphobacter sp.]
MSFELILPFFPEELRVLLMDPSISDFMINGTTGVFADRAGEVEHIPLSAPYTNDRLQAAIERVARLLGQDLTSQNPILNTRLPDGSRVAVVGSPSSINGPTLTVRKFNRWYTSDELVAAGGLPAHVRDAAVGLITKRKNGIISGGTGSGKSTLMKALLDHVPLYERLVVIEQPAELKILHPNAVRWEADRTGRARQHRRRKANLLGPASCTDGPSWIAPRHRPRPACGSGGAVRTTPGHSQESHQSESGSDSRQACGEKDSGEETESSLSIDTLAPDSSGADLSLDPPRESRRENPLRFLPALIPLALPAPARRLRGKESSSSSLHSVPWLAATFELGEQRSSGLPVF